MKGCSPKPTLISHSSPFALTLPLQLCMGMYTLGWPVVTFTASRSSDTRKTTICTEEAPV